MSEAGVQSPTGGSPKPQEFTENFDFYVRFAKPLVLNLSAPNERVLAAAWVQKLSDTATGDEKTRTDYLKLLLFVLQKGRLFGPFARNPATVELDDLGMRLIDVAKCWLETEENLKKRRFILGLSSEYPVINAECSGDLKEYAASQDIPNFGIHAYYAFSNDPITEWNNIEKGIFPKGALSAIKKADSLSAVSEHTRKSRTKSKEKSVEAIIKGRSKSKTRSRSASRSRVEGVKGSAGDMTDQSFKKVSFGPDDEKSRLKTFPKSSSPLGSPLPAETRSPPTWGSNLISVSDPPPAEGVLATSFDDTELKCSSKDIFQVTSKRDLFGAIPPEDRSPIFYESSPSYHDVSDIEIPPLRKPSTPTPPRPKRPYDSADFIRRRKMIRRPFDSAPRLKYNEWGLPVQDLTPMSAPSLPYLTPPRFYDEAPSLPYLTPPQYYDEAPSLPYLTPPGRPPSSSDEVDEAMRKINEQYQQLFSPPEKSDSPVAETAEDIEMKRRLDSRAAMLAQRRVQMLAQQQPQQAAIIQAPTTCADQELTEFEQLEAQLGFQAARPRMPSPAERRATEMAMRQAELRAQQQFRTLEPSQIEYEPTVRRRSPQRQAPPCIDPEVAEFEQMEAQLGIRPSTIPRLPSLAERRSSRTMLRRMESRVRNQMRSLQPQVQITDQTIRQVVAEETPAVSEQAQAIVEEAMEDLAQAVEPEQTLEEMYAEQDLRYPDRRGDIQRTPPVFSKVVKIREGPGRKLTYAAAEFGLSEDEQFVPGPEFMRGRTALSPRVDEREMLRRTREPFDIFDLAAEADDILNVDDIEAILVPSPKSRSLERSLREATTSHLQQAMENIPALGGVPATIPTKSPLPLRSPENLYFEDAPSFLSPCRTPEAQGMPRLSPQAPRLSSPGRVSPVRSPRRTSPVRTSPIRTSPALRQTSPMRMEYVPYADPCPETATLLEKYQSPPPPREPTPPPRVATPPKPKRKVLRLPARARPKKLLKPTKPVPVPKPPEPPQPAPKTPPKRIEKTLQEKVAEMHEQFQDLYSSLVEDEDDTCHGGMTPQGRPSPYFSPTTPPLPPRRRSPTRTPPRATIPDIFDLPYSPGWGGEPDFVDDYSICSPQAFEQPEDNFLFTETELTYASPPPLTPEEVQPQVTVVPCGRSPSQPQQLALPSPSPRSPPQQLALPAPCARQSFTPPPPITAPATAPHVVASVASVTSITVSQPQARSPIQTMEERQYAASFADPEQAALMQRVLKVVKTVPGHSPICPDNFFEQYEGQDVNIVDTPPELIHDLDFPDATPDQSFDFRDFAPSPEIKDSRIVASIQSQEAELGIAPCQAAAPTQAAICTPDDSFERLEYEAYKEAQEEAMQVGQQIEAPPRYMRPPDIFDFVAGMPTEGIGGGLYDIDQPEDFGDQEILSPARTPPCSPQDHIIYEGDAPEYYSPEMVRTESIQEVEVRYTTPPPQLQMLGEEPERICVSPQQISPVTQGQGVCPGAAQPRSSRQSFRPSYPEISPDQGPIDDVLFKSRILMAESPEYRDSMSVRPGSIKGRSRVVRRGARPMLHPDIPEEGEGSYGRPTLRPRPRRQREYQPCGAYVPSTGVETAAAQIAAEEQRRAQILYTPTRVAPAATAAPARRRRKPTRKGRKIDFGAAADAEWYSNFPPEIQEAVIHHGLSPPTPEGLPENLLGDGGVGQFYAPRGLMDLSIDENLPKPMSPEEYYGIVPFRRRVSPKPARKVLSPWRPGLLSQGQDLLICTQPADFAGSPEMASIPDQYESPESLQTAAPCFGGYVPITPPPAVSPLQPSPKRVFGPQRPSPGYQTPPRRLPPSAMIAANKQYQDLLRDSPPDDLPPCAMGAPCGAAEIARPSTPPLAMLGAGSPRTPTRTPPSFYQRIGGTNIYEDDPCLVPASPPSPMTQMRQAVAQAVGRSGIKRTRPRRRLSAPRLSRIEQEDEVITPSPRMATPPPRMATPPLRIPTPPPLPPCGPAPVYGPPTYAEYLQEMVTEVNADIFDEDGVQPTMSPPTQLDIQWQLLKDQMQVMGGIDDFEDMAQYASPPRTPSPQARPPTPPTPPTPPCSPRPRYSPDLPCDVRSPIDVFGSPEYIGSPDDPFNEGFQGYSPPGYEGPITPPRMVSPKRPSPKIASPVQPIPAAYPDPRLSPVRYRSPSPPPGSPEFRRRVEQHVPASYKRKRRRPPPPRIMSPVLEGLSPQYESPVRSPLRPRSSPRYSSSPESSPRDIFNEQIRFSDIVFDMNEPSFIGSPNEPSPDYYPMGEIFDAEDITQGYSSPEPCVPEEVLYFTPPEFPQSPCRPAVRSPARSPVRSPVRSSARSPAPRSPVRSSAPLRSPIRQPMPIAPMVQTPPRIRTPPQVARIPSPRSATPPPAPRTPSPRARTPPMIVPCGSPGPSPDFMERIRQHQPVRRKRPKRIRQPGIMESITEITQVERTPGLPAVFQRSSQIIFTPRQVSPQTPPWARSADAPISALPEWLEDVEIPDDYERTPPCGAPCNAVLDTSPIPEDQPTTNFDWL